MDYRRPNRDDLERFIEQVEIFSSVNFPMVAKGLGLNYKFIDEALRDSKWFKEELGLVLERMKFNLIQTINELALGKNEKSRANLKAIREMIDLIDSGALIGERPGSPDNDDGETADDIKKRLGLDDEEAPSPD